MSGTANDLTTLNQQIADAEELTSGSYTITLSADIFIFLSYYPDRSRLWRFADDRR